MKGLLKYLSPFAPDQSGAVSALYTYGGIIVICDAGGCTGNICGFDEPRWFESKSAVFSAGLRDMDAILGRDDRLVEKLRLAADQIGGKFAAIIGTPVPAVIATDYRALVRMAEKKCDMPVLAVECTGTRLYDEGAGEAYLNLFKKILGLQAKEAAEESVKKVSDIESAPAVGILGLIPMDVGRLTVKDELESHYRAKGYEKVYCYGMGDGLDAVAHAGEVDKNVVVAPAALPLARFLEKEYGIPYETEYPFPEDADRIAEEFSCIEQSPDKEKSFDKVLIIHQQVAANEIRRKLRQSDPDLQIICGSFFLMDDELKEEGDLHFEREDEFIDYVLQEGFDTVIGDAMFKRALRDFKGKYITFDHGAVSGVN